jgi:acyl carrier protein
VVSVIAQSLGGPLALKDERDAKAKDAWLISQAACVIEGASGIFREICGKKISMQSVDSEVRSRITALVRGILAQNSVTAAVTADALLVDIGLTSMDMVNLMLGVEAEFDFTIPQEQITPENFQSVQSLERLVMEQLQAA